MLLAYTHAYAIALMYVCSRHLSYKFCLSMPRAWKYLRFCFFPTSSLLVLSLWTFHSFYCHYAPEFHSIDNPVPRWCRFSTLVSKSMTVHTPSGFLRPSIGINVISAQSCLLFIDPVRVVDFLQPLHL